jgi:hypothetical protein
MSLLPDQISPDELDALIERYREELAGLTTEPGGPRLIGVRGGRVASEALGAALIEPTGELVYPLAELTPIVELRYENVSPGPLRIRTTPARLVRVGPAWQTEQMLAAPRRVHRFHAPEPALRLAFSVAGAGRFAAAPPLPVSGASGASGAAADEHSQRYTIPPAATKIRGTGTLYYRTGHVVPVDGEQVIERPLSDGTLGLRPSGVYAEFDGPSAPDVRIGTTWIPARPTS